MSRRRRPARKSRRAGRSESPGTRERVDHCVQCCLRGDALGSLVPPLRQKRRDQGDPRSLRCGHWPLGGGSLVTCPGRRQAREAAHGQPAWGPRLASWFLPRGPGPRRGQAPPAPGGAREPRPTVGPASLGVATTTLRPNVRLVLEPASASRTQGRWLGRSWHRGHWNRPPRVSWSSRVVHPESPGLGFQIPLPPTSPSHKVSEMRGAVRWRLVGPRGGPGGPSYLPM